MFLVVGTWGHVIAGRVLSPRCAGQGALLELYLIQVNRREKFVVLNLLYLKKKK